MQVRRKRKSNPSARYGDFATLAFLTTEAMAENVSDAEPTCVEDAIEMSENKNWSDAMADEIT